MSGKADAAAIQQWMLERFARLMKVRPSDLDPGKPLTSFGIDSVEAVTIVGELGEWLGVKLSPTLLWDYPTIQALSRYLGEGK